MELNVVIRDYGRYGCVATDPWTGIKCSAQTREQAVEQIREELKTYAESAYLSPSERPVVSIETVRI